MSATQIKKDVDKAIHHLDTPEGIAFLKELFLQYIRERENTDIAAILLLLVLSRKKFNRRQQALHDLFDLLAISIVERFEWSEESIKEKEGQTDFFSFAGSIPNWSTDADQLRQDAWRIKK